MNVLVLTGSLRCMGTLQSCFQTPPAITVFAQNDNHVLNHIYVPALDTVNFWPPGLEARTDNNSADESEQQPVYFWSSPRHEVLQLKRNNWNQASGFVLQFPYEHMKEVRIGAVPTQCDRFILRPLNICSNLCCTLLGKFYNEYNELTSCALSFVFASEMELQCFLTLLEKEYINNHSFNFICKNERCIIFHPLEHRILRQHSGGGEGLCFWYIRRRRPQMEDDNVATTHVCYLQAIATIPGERHQLA
jgi:hypothetical protein